MALKRKIAFIDLSREKIDITGIQHHLRSDYLGGRCLADYLLYQNTPAGINPLSSKNTLIISAGLLCGTPGIPSVQAYITFKSPLTGTLVSSAVSGSFASEMRWTGFDHLVIKGKAKKPVYLFINNGNIEIKSAARLWKRGIYESQQNLRTSRHDEEIQILAIGPAGENLVRFATVASSLKNATDCAGAGAVFGSKNLKAVACKGTMGIEIKNPKQAIKLSKQVIKRIQNAKENTRQNKENFPQNDFPEHDLANDYGIDQKIAANLIEWVNTLYHNNLISEKAAQPYLAGPDNSFDHMRQVIQCLATRNGLGDILAEGPVKAEKKLGKNYLRFYPAGESSETNVISTADAADTAEKLYSIRAMSVLGVPPSYSPFLLEKNSFHPEFLRLIELNLGEGITQSRLMETAKRSYTLERLFNLREGTSPEKEAVNDTYYSGDGSKKNNSREFHSQSHTIRNVFYTLGLWNKNGLPSPALLKELNMAGLGRPQPEKRKNP